jgi:hypothetical protein
MSLHTLWAVALLVGVFALGTCWLVDSAFTAAIMITLLGIPFSAAYSVPWTLVTVAAGSSTATGKITAAFNLSQCIPEVVVAIGSGFFFSGAGGSAARRMRRSSCDGCSRQALSAWGWLRSLRCVRFFSILNFIVFNFWFVCHVSIGIRQYREDQRLLP